MITERREESLDLTILTGSGAVTLDEVAGAMQEMYLGGPTMRVLWDLSGADVSSMNFDDVQEISQLAVTLGGSRPGGKTAIVTDQQVVFGISRVYESMAGDGAPITQHVCDSLPQALEFLGIDSLPAR